MPNTARQRRARIEAFKRAALYPHLPFNVPCPTCGAPIEHYCTRTRPDGTVVKSIPHYERRAPAALALKHFVLLCEKAAAEAAARAEAIHDQQRRRTIAQGRMLTAQAAESALHSQLGALAQRLAAQPTAHCPAEPFDPQLASYRAGNAPALPGAPLTAADLSTREGESP